MELLALIIGVGVMVWAFDFDKPVREVATMANREVTLQNAAHKTKAVNAYAKLELKEEDVAKAKAVQQMLNSFDI